MVCVSLDPLVNFLAGVEVEELVHGVCEVLGLGRHVLVSHHPVVIQQVLVQVSIVTGGRPVVMDVFEEGEVHADVITHGAGQAVGETSLCEVKDASEVTAEPLRQDLHLGEPVTPGISHQVEHLDARLDEFQQGAEREDADDLGALEFAPATLPQQPVHAQVTELDVGEALGGAGVEEGTLGVAQLQNLLVNLTQLTAQQVAQVPRSLIAHAPYVQLQQESPGLK